MSDYDKQIDEIVALIKYDVEYATTHGGCPPAVKAIRRSGVTEAKAALHDLLTQSCLDELEQLTKLNDRFTFIEVRDRIATLKAKQQGGK